jgi:endonuclease YncB( thermonuclease family)
VLVRDTDRYGRTVAEVILPDGRNVNQEMVKAGYAWWFRKYAPNDGVLEDFEAEARNAKRGLWADTHAMPPWEYRRNWREMKYLGKKFDINQISCWYVIVSVNHLFLF